MSSPSASITRDYNNIITALQKGLSGTIGDKFLANLIEELANVLSADTAIIGIISEDGLEINTLAVFTEGAIAPNYSYDLLGTPCHETTAGSDACVFTKAVAKLFPLDEALQVNGIVSYVGIPLVDSQKKVIGIINTLHKKEIKDPEFAMQIINVFSSRASAEIERKIQSLALEEKEKFQSALNQIFEAILPQKSEDDILWEVAEQCVKVLNPTDCVIYIYEQESELLVQKAAVSRLNKVTTKDVSPLSIPVGEGIVGAVAKNRIGEVVNDTSQDARYIEDEAARYSEIAAPIIVNDELIGVIDSEHPDKGYFTQWHLNLLEKIAAFLGVKVSNARTEQKLQYQAHRYELAMNAVGVGIWDWNFSTNEVYYSPRWMEILGYGPDEMPHVLDTWKNQVHEDDVDIAMDKISDYLSGESEEYMVEFRMKHKEGAYVDILAKGYIVKDRHGRPQRLAGTHEDISERKKKSAALEESEKQFRILAENSPMRIVLIDNDCHIQYVNHLPPRANKSKIYGASALEHVEEKYHEIILKTVSSVFTKGTTEKCYSEALDINGNLVRYDNHIAPIFENEKVVSAIVISQDITQQKKYEEEIRKLALVAQKTDNGVIILDREQKVEYVNEGFTRIFGYNIEDITGSKFGDKWFSAINIDGGLLDYLNNQLACGKSGSAEFSTVDKSNSQIWAEIEMQPILNGKGQIDKYICITKDISARRTSESALVEQNKLLRKTNKELDNFVYSVSHDLRAPIASSLGLIGLTRIEKDPEQINNYLDLQERSLKKLDGFIQDILNYSRNSRLDVELGEINIEPLINECLDQFHFLSHSKNMEKSVVIKGQHVIVSDQRRLNVVLNNLISNAIRFVHPQREKPWIKIVASIKKHVVLIKVADNGIGIDDEFQKRIFEMFYRANETKSGSGLGLYIVKETIEKMGGTISVESKLGQGATFIIKIPNEKP